MILPQSTSWSTCLPSCFPMNIAIISRFPVRLATTGGTIYGQLGGGHGLFWRSGSARWIITRHSGWVHPKDRGFTNKGGRDWPHQETWDSTNQDEGCKHGAKIYRQKNGETKWWKYGGLKAPTNGDKLQCDASKCNYQKMSVEMVPTQVTVPVKNRQKWLTPTCRSAGLDGITNKKQPVQCHGSTLTRSNNRVPWIMGSFHLQCFWALGAPRGVVFLSAPFVKRLDTSILSKIRLRILLLLNKNTPS